MKTTTKLLTAAMIILMLITNTVLAKGTKSNPGDFTINGIIVKTNKKLDSKCKIELFNENQLVDSSIIKMNKPFELKLKKDVWYTLRVTKEGFLPLMISFNTETYNEEVLNNEFHFETELIELAEAKFLNPDLIDFPVGIVALNKDTKKFEARETYTNNYTMGLFQTPQLPADIVKEYVSKSKLTSGMC